MTSPTDQIPAEFIEVGKLSGVYGVKGWQKVFSYTEPRENILTYNPWYLYRQGTWVETPLERGKPHGKGVVAKLKGCDDRDLAHAMIGTRVAIRRSQLADTVEGEYYWTDLIGLAVRNTQGCHFGVVDSLIETGANDVLVIKGGKDDRERLIPYVWQQFVLQVDLDNEQMLVDWDEDFLE